MGQYYALLNLDHRTGFSPDAVSDYVKLMECGQSYNTPRALLELLAASENWAGNRIAVVGDYAEDDDLPGIESLCGVSAGSLYEAFRVGSQGFRDIGESVADMLTRSYGRKELDPHQSMDPAGYVGARAGDPMPVVVVNEDKGQLLDPLWFGTDASITGAAGATVVGGYIVDEIVEAGHMGTALVTLLAVGCQGGPRGGGDINSRSSLVGSWAGDRVRVIAAADAGDGYEDISHRIRMVLADAGEGKYRESGETVRRLNPFGTYLGA